MHRKYWPAIFFSCVVAAELIVIGIKRDLAPADWAAWVQAVGAIAALAIAILISTMQGKSAADLAEKSELRALVRQAVAAQLIIEKLKKAFDHSTALFQGDQAGRNLYDGLGLSSIEELYRIVDNMPLYALASPQMISGILEMKKAVQQILLMRDESIKWIKNGDNDPDFWDFDAISMHTKHARLAFHLAFDVFMLGVAGLRSEA